MRLNEVKDGLKHLYKKNGNTYIHIKSINGNPMILVLGQNKNTETINIKVDNTCKGLVRTALKCLHNPNHILINDITNHINITLLDNVVCAGAIIKGIFSKIIWDTYYFYFFFIILSIFYLFNKYFLINGVFLNE